MSASGETIIIELQQYSQVPAASPWYSLLARLWCLVPVELEGYETL
jgi:hypothetical protein